jgi:hypothetical protein
MSRIRIVLIHVTTFRNNFRNTRETLNSPWDFFSFLTFKLVLKRRRFDDIIIIEEQLQVVLAEFMRQTSAIAFNNNEIIGSTKLSYNGSTSKGRAWNSRQQMVNAVITE